MLESAGRGFRFRYALLRETLYAGIPVPVRAGLHRQAGRALAVLGAPPGRVARQLLAIPDPGEGEDWETDWLVANAAGLAGQVPAVAADLLDQALSRLGTADPRRGGLETQLAEALFLLGRHKRAEQVCRATLPLVTDPERYGRLAWLRGYALLRMQRYADATRALDTAAARPDISAAWQARFAALRAMVLQAPGAAHTDAGVAAAVAAAAASALEGGRAFDDSIAVAYALHVQSIARAGRGDLDGAVALIDEAGPLAVGEPAPHRLAATHDLQPGGHARRAWPA